MKRPVESNIGTMLEALRDANIDIMARYINFRRSVLTADGSVVFDESKIWSDRIKKPEDLAP